MPNKNNMSRKKFPIGYSFLSLKSLYLKGEKMRKKELIGLRIKDLRKRRGLSQEELAERAETSANYLSRMERGTENPTLDMLIKIAHALGVEMWEIFDFGHAVNIKELRETMNKLLKDTDEEKLRLAVKILRAVVR